MDGGGNLLFHVICHCSVELCSFLCSYIVILNFFLHNSKMYTVNDCLFPKARTVKNIKLSARTLLPAEHIMSIAKLKSWNHKNKCRQLLSMSNRSNKRKQAKFARIKEIIWKYQQQIIEDPMKQILKLFYKQ